MMHVLLFTLGGIAVGLAFSAGMIGFCAFLGWLFDKLDGWFGEYSVPIIIFGLIGAIIGLIVGISR